MKDKEKESFIKRLFKRKRLLIFLVAILLLGFIVYRRSSSSKSSNGNQPIKVQRGNVSEELILSGKVDADEYIALSYPAAGKVSWVGVKEGDSVKRGQALGKLDTVALNAAYQQAQSALRAAEANVAYVHDQVKDNDADESFLEKNTRTTAEVTKDQAYEAVKIAQENLRNATLYAPFAGVVSSVSAPYPGITVLPTEKHFEVINPDTLFFEVTADQTEVVEIYDNQKANIVLDAYPEESLSGVVTFVSYTPLAGDVGTSYKVKIKVEENFSRNLKKFRLGMGGDAKFILKEESNVLYLPPKYIKTDSKGKYVNLEKKNNKVYIETGLEGEDAVEIKSGLTEGQLVYD